MKIRNFIIHFLMYLPLLYDVILLPFLPSSIPAHFDANNIVNRWGSKYEILIFPIVIIIFGLIMRKINNYIVKENSKSYEIGIIIMLVVFNLLNAYITFTSYYTVTNLEFLHF